MNLHNKTAFKKRIDASKYFNLIVFILVLIPFSIAFIEVYTNGVSIWYDDARDLLSAWDNLHKLTLIGPTTGISGIFYGPYWIWLLSFGLLFSKDPRIVTLLTATIPYYVIFPLLWFRFSRVFGKLAVSLGWLLFILSPNGITYATQLWNIYPAPLITMIILYISLTIDFTKFTKKTVYTALLLGFLLGLLINFSVSFGLGFFVGLVIFLFWDLISNGRFTHFTRAVLLKKILFRLLIIPGFLIAFIPFFLFEFRHGLSQIKTVITTLNKFGNVVTVVSGLTKTQILQEFPNTLGKMLYVTPLLGVIILFAAIAYYIVCIIRKTTEVSLFDKKVLALVISLLSGIALIYFSARNPVWSYHFLGVDVIYTLLLTFLMSKIRFLRLVCIIIVIYGLLLNIYLYVPPLFAPRITYFDIQQKVVNTVASDAGPNNYVVFSYSASIYMYDYSYMFRWLANKNVPYDPGFTPQGSKIVYLITPVQKNAEVIDFIHNRSPLRFYKTAHEWFFPGTEVIKRVRS